MSPVEALLEIVRSEGVTRIFGNPGTTELPLINALSDAPDLTYVLGLHEGAVVSMADGYARTTGRPSVLNLHAAAGVANGLIGMLNAKRSRTPMVVTAGQQDRRHLIQDPMLAGDLVALAASVTKHAAEVQHAQDLPLILRRAFGLAVQPPSGPVLVSIPMDLLAERAQVSVPSRSECARLGAAEPAGIGRAADLLVEAESPVVVAGDGVGLEHAVGELVRVAERLGATVWQQPMYDGVNFPAGHPLYAGMLAPRHSAIRHCLTGHDALLLVGCRAFTPHHYSPGSPIPEGMRIVQIDSDAAQLGRNFAVELGLTGDVTATLHALSERIGDRCAVAGDRIQTARAASKRRRQTIERRSMSAYPTDDPGAGSAIHPHAAAHAIASALPPDAIVVEEAITVGLLLRDLVRQETPGAYLHTVGGGLGWGIGAGIGAQLGCPDRPVVSVVGDGCAMFGLQGLWSAVHYDVPVVFIVMNNGEYRTLKHSLDEHRGQAGAGSYVGLDLAPPALDWTEAARFFGMDSVRVERANDLRDVVAVSVANRTPTLVDVRISGHHHESRS